jgi:hypothetical protein
MAQVVAEGANGPFVREPCIFFGPEDFVALIGSVIQVVLRIHKKHGQGFCLAPNTAGSKRSKRRSKA